MRKIIYTDEKGIKAWRDNKHKGISQKKIANKLKVSQRAICRWIEKVEKDPTLHQRAVSYSEDENNENNEILRKITDPKRNDTKISQLNSQIEFLKWWNLGERKGFVELLLNELRKDPE